MKNLSLVFIFLTQISFAQGDFGPTGGSLSDIEDSMKTLVNGSSWEWQTITGNSASSELDIYHGTFDTLTTGPIGFPDQRISVYSGYKNHTILGSNNGVNLVTPYNPMFPFTSNSNILIGHNLLTDLTDFAGNDGNIVLGLDILSHFGWGGNNIALGTSCLGGGVADGSVGEGISSNISLGQYSLSHLGTASNATTDQGGGNIAIGQAALLGLTRGDQNVAIGWNSGIQIGDSTNYGNIDGTVSLGAFSVSKQNGAIAIGDSSSSPTGFTSQTVIGGSYPHEANRLTVRGNSYLDGSVTVSVDSITFVGEDGDIIDASTGNIFRGTLGQNDTLSISNMSNGQQLNIVITNGGAHTLDWSGINWTGGTVPTLTSGENKRDVFTIIKVGEVMYGNYVQDMR